MGIILTSTGLPLLTSTGLIASRVAAGTPPVPLPKPDPEPELKPEPVEITPLGPVRSITHRGVTFNFSSGVYWYESANGDPVVITSSTYLPSGTSITSITPGSAIINGAWAHGAMRGDAIPHASTSGYQGFDQFMASEAGGSEQTPYVHGLNVDPGASGAVQINTGTSTCIIKSVRDTAVTSGSGGGNTTMIDRYVPLTFQSSLPPSAGTWFRPAAFHPRATRAWTYRLEDIDMSVFRTLAAPSGAWSASTSLNDLRARKMEHPPLWCNQHDPGQRFLLRGEDDVKYARDYSRLRCRWACSLHINPGSKTTEINARDTLAAIFAQWAIDMDGSHQLGNTGSAGAGHWHGWVPFLFMAAFMFSNSTETRAAATAMLDRALAHGSNTFDLQFWVSGQDVGYPYPWWETTRSSSKRMVIETYQTTDLGVPEWRIWKEAKGGSNNLHTSYRDTQFTTLLYEMMAIGLLRNGFGTGQTGDAASRNGPDDVTNPRAASLKYLDRLMTIKPWIYNNNGNTAESENMYNLWRDSIPSPRWAGRPDVPANPVDEPSGGGRQIAPGAGSGQIAFRFNWLDYNTNPPILDRQVQVSQDKYAFSEDSAAQFVDVSVIKAGNTVGTAGTGTLSGFRPGTTHLVRWRQRNASGWSRWTAHWELADQSGSAEAAYKAPRNQITTPGSSATGQALANVVAPAILYKPHHGSYTPLFEPVTAAAKITVFYAGIGYWQGGTGALSATYQWQRSANGTSGWSNVGTGQRYVRQAGDGGQYIRCRVTVTDGAGASSVADSNVLPVPAAEANSLVGIVLEGLAPPASALINVDFDGSAPFDYPSFWASMATGVTGATLNHYPTWQIEPDATRGVVSFLKSGQNPGFEAEVSPSAAAGSYRWTAQIGGAYFPLHTSDSSPADTVIQIKNGAGSVLSSGTAPAARLPNTLTVSGSFALASPTALRVRLYTPTTKTGGSGAMGGPTISNLRIWML
jgi:hypothetical protein